MSDKSRVGLATMGIIKSFDIRGLKPFHRTDGRLPQPGPETEDKIAELDPGLTPEEQSYVNHYVGYADVLLNESGDESSQTPDNVVEIRRRNSRRHSNSDDSNEKDKVA